MLDNINIRRFNNHAAGYLGAITPGDGKWKLVIDGDANPHLFLRVFVEPGKSGWLSLEDLLPKGMSVVDFIDGEAFDEPSTEAELAAALEEYDSRPRVCPAC